MVNLEKNLDYIMIFSIPECNLFCKYCRKDDKRKGRVLTNDEILELAQACFDAGIRRVRWTGGEPTIRKNFVDLVSRVKEIGIEKQYLSTNGTLLYKMAPDLKNAGIQRVNISLDTFDKHKFYELTGKDLLDEVLRSIEVAAKVFKLVKINSVLISDNINDVYKFIDFVAGFNNNPPIPRFIPLGGCGGTEERLYNDKELLQPQQILEAFSEKYGKIKSFDDIENNNPYIQHYLIESNKVVFGIITLFFTQRELDPSQFKTLRINPNGYVSNDLHSPDIYFLPNLDHDGKVDLLKRLIEDKKTYTKDWYTKAIGGDISRDLNFWRFGE